MSGIEALVLVPLVYGCVHLGKKVLEQSRVIDNQNALIDVQRDTISVLQTQTSGSPADGSALGTWGASLFLQRAVAFSGVAVAASAVAYNTHRWLQVSQRSHHPNPGSLDVQHIRPSDNYKPTVASSEADECRVCCEHQRDTLLLPCRHFALCWPCAHKILEGDERKCPLCRAEISSAQFTFVV